MIKGLEFNKNHIFLLTNVQKALCLSSYLNLLNIKALYNPVMGRGEVVKSLHKITKDIIRLQEGVRLVEQYHRQRIKENPNFC